MSHRSALSIPETSRGAATWGIVPVKCFHRAKSRLAPLLTPPQRAGLARALFGHVLEVLAACPELDRILVATDCLEVERMARDAGAEVLHDAGPAALGAIVDRALSHVEARGAARALVLMSDLPLIDAPEVSRLLRLLDDSELVVAPDLEDAGTNALAIALGGLAPGRTATCFGNPDSFPRHQRLASSQGLRLAIHRSPRLGFDIDLPADLRAFRRQSDALQPAAQP